jgi:hypothetical protein
MEAQVLPVQAYEVMTAFPLLHYSPFVLILLQPSWYSNTHQAVVWVRLRSINVVTRASSYMHFSFSSDQFFWANRVERLGVCDGVPNFFRSIQYLLSLTLFCENF